MNKTLTFKDRQSFREWLDKNGTESGGVWLRFGKDESLVTLSASEALEEALCHGWIDGQMQSLDAHSYIKYFARRVSNSKWSPKNKELAEKLIEKGLMTQKGLDAIENARKNGAWENARRITIDEEQIQAFKDLIKPHATAYTNLQAMSLSVQRAYTGFYLDAKSDKTRQTRLEKIVERLNQNLKPM